MLIQLNKEEVRRGYLTERDFSTAAGFKVKAFDLADFPHYDELEKHSTLPPDKFEQRADAIYGALEGADLLKPGGSFSRADVEYAAGQTFASLRSVSEAVSLHSSTGNLFFQHFETVRRNGFKKAHRPGSPIWWERNNSEVKDVFPAVLDEDIPVYKIFRKYAAFVLTDHSRSARQDWSKSTGIPEALLTRVPSDGAGLLATDLHEARHLKQLSCMSPWQAVPDFYAELDADMASRAALRSAGIGRETIEAWRHQRYFAMLTISSPIYRFESTLEALEKNLQPHNMFAVHRALVEMRVRIAMHYKGGDAKKVNSSILQNAIGAWDKHPGSQPVAAQTLTEVATLVEDYREIKGAMYGRNPAPLYTALRQLVDAKAFTDSFTKETAEKILKSACHFNPDLICNDREASRRRMDSAMEPQPPRRQGGLARQFGQFIKGRP